jgi:hypothetical protein
MLCLFKPVASQTTLRARVEQEEPMLIFWLRFYNLAVTSQNSWSKTFWTEKSHGLRFPVWGWDILQFTKCNWEKSSSDIGIEQDPQRYTPSRTSDSGFLQWLPMQGRWAAWGKIWTDPQPQDCKGSIELTLLPPSSVMELFYLSRPLLTQICDAPECCWTRDLEKSGDPVARDPSVKEVNLLSTTSEGQVQVRSLSSCQKLHVLSQWNTDLIQIQQY